MKICYFIPSFSCAGGTEKILAKKINYLSNDKYKFSLVISDQIGKELIFPIENTIKIYDIKINNLKLSKLNF